MDGDDTVESLRNLQRSLRPIFMTFAPLESALRTRGQSFARSHGHNRGRHHCGILAAGLGRYHSSVGMGASFLLLLCRLHPGRQPRLVLAVIRRSSQYKNAFVIDRWNPPFVST